MRLLPLLLLLCLVVIAVEGGGRKKYCGKRGKGWCSRGHLCRPCHRGYCCRPPALTSCRYVGQPCGYGRRRVCRYAYGRLRCLLRISRRACQRKCYGYCRRCSIGYCCVRCSGKPCHPCGKGRYCKG